MAWHFLTHGETSTYDPAAGKSGVTAANDGVAVDLGRAGSVDVAGAAPVLTSVAVVIVAAVSGLDVVRDGVVRPLVKADDGSGDVLLVGVGCTVTIDGWDSEVGVLS